MPGIVVGVDGSTGSVRALSWAAREAALHHSQLTVLTVHPTLISQWTSNPVKSPGDAADRETARQAAQEATLKVTSELGDAQPAGVTVEAVSGSPAGELIKASHDADLVVVGSRGGGGFASLLVGSVSSQVVHHAASPVVVIPAGK
jgi:nucleotide-binding universal stress UspA family protein